MTHFLSRLKPRYVSMSTLILCTYVIYVYEYVPCSTYFKFLVVRVKLSQTVTSNRKIEI